MGICCCLLAPQTNSGTRPYNQQELQRMYIRNGQVYAVSDEPSGKAH
jgi:hypothetical protein